MLIRNLIWLEDVVDKLEQKHNVLQEEVTFVMNSRPYIRFISKGRKKKKRACMRCMDVPKKDVT